MTREEKVEEVKNLTELLAEKPNVYIADAGGLTVDQMNKLRGMCFDAGVQLKVVKNTLLKKAMDASDVDYSSIYGSLKQQSSVFFVSEDLKGPAKIISNFRKKDDKPSLKAAYIDGADFIGDDNLPMLMELKSKNELIADVVALLESPMINVLGQLQSGANTVTGLLKALEAREEA